MSEPDKLVDEFFSQQASGQIPYNPHFYVMNYANQEGGADTQPPIQIVSPTEQMVAQAKSEVKRNLKRKHPLPSNGASASPAKKRKKSSSSKVRKVSQTGGKRKQPKAGKSTSESRRKSTCSNQKKKRTVTNQRGRGTSRRMKQQGKKKACRRHDKNKTKKTTKAGKKNKNARGRLNAPAKKQMFYRF